MTCVSQSIILRYHCTNLSLFIQNIPALVRNYYFTWCSVWQRLRWRRTHSCLCFIRIVSLL